MSPDLLRLPPERDLPPGRQAQLRAVLLRAGHPSPVTRPGFRWVVPVASAAAVVVVALVLGALFALPHRGALDPARPSSTTTRVRPPAIVLQARAIGSAERVKKARECLKQMDRSTKGFRVEFAETLLQPGSPPGDFLLVREASGEELLCAPDGTSSVDGARAALSTADWPALVLVGDATWWEASPDGRTIRRAGTSALLRVGPQVTEVRARVATPGRDTPWYTAPIMNGYAVARAEASDFPNTHNWTDNITLEISAVDADGSELYIR